MARTGIRATARIPTNRLEALAFGPLTDRTAHICIDMQNVFAEETPWHTPWMARVLPGVTTPDTRLMTAPGLSVDVAREGRMVERAVIQSGLNSRGRSPNRRSSTPIPARSGRTMAEGDLTRNCDKAYRSKCPSRLVWLETDLDQVFRLMDRSICGASGGNRHFLGHAMPK
jgi:hypothetical protein